MKFNPKIHNRKSIRLKEYDYSNPNWYYLTICTYDKRNILGKIINGKMNLNNCGKIVEEEWLKTKEIRQNIDLDYYIIMPNHLHGIIIIERRGELHSSQMNSQEKNNDGRIQYAPTNNKLKSPSQTVGAIVRGFKSSVTKRIREFNQKEDEKVWQRNYYEHIIRNEKDFYRIRNYIQNNPLKWELDEYFSN